MKRIILIFMVCALMAAPVLATPTILGGGLQSVLDAKDMDGDGVIDNQHGILIAGPSYPHSSVTVTTDMLSDLSDSYWNTTASAQGSATMIIELASYAGTNVFGVYNSGVYAPLFLGSDQAGDTASVSIKTDGSVYVNSSDTGLVFASTTFGFYLDSTDDGQGGIRPNSGLWHSDTALNADSTDHMAAYQGLNIDTVKLHSTLPAGIWTDDEYILAFEDLDFRVGSDSDYTDFVVMVQSVTPIPAPGAILLGSIGVGLVGWLRKRKTL